MVDITKDNIDQIKEMDSENLNGQTAGSILDIGKFNKNIKLIYIFKHINSCI